MAYDLSIADGSVDLEISDAYGNAHFVNVVAADNEYIARDQNGRSLAWIALAT